MLCVISLINKLCSDRAYIYEIEKKEILSQFLNILKNSSLGSLNASWFFISSVKMESLCLLQLWKLNKNRALLKYIYTSISQSLAVLSQMFFPILSWGGIWECHFYGWKVNEMKLYNKDKVALHTSAHMKL